MQNNFLILYLGPAGGHISFPFSGLVIYRSTISSVQLLVLGSVCEPVGVLSPLLAQRDVQTSSTQVGSNI